MLSNAEAQTVLSGDHVVEGDLEVGTATQEGGLTIKGETGNTASPGIRVTGDGGVVFEGTKGVGTLPSTSGVAMIWYPAKASMRVGEPYSSQWTSTEIGVGSVAFSKSEGYGSYSTAAGGGYAAGDYSTALSGGEAHGVSSFAQGWGFAEADYSTALGGGVTRGISSVALSGGTAEGNYSTAMSSGVSFAVGSTSMSFADASGSYSTAMSEGIATGNSSTAMSGGETWGTSSTAMSGGTAEGAFSVAAGYQVTAVAYRSVVLGSRNRPDFNESAGSWVGTESLFVIGNGTGSLSDPPEKRESDAFVVLKNGTIRIPKRQGDILMGEFGNPEP